MIYGTGLSVKFCSLFRGLSIVEIKGRTFEFCTSINVLAMIVSGIVMKISVLDVLPRDRLQEISVSRNGDGSRLQTRGSFLNSGTIETLGQPYSLRSRRA